MLFVSLLIAKFFKSSHISARIFFTFWKNVENKTWNSFDTKFQPQWKGRKSSYQVRQILGIFWSFSCCNFKFIAKRSLQKAFELPKNVKKIKFEGVCEESAWKKEFPGTITQYISETNSSFQVEAHNRKTLISIF